MSGESVYRRSAVGKCGMDFRSLVLKKTAGSVWFRFGFVTATDIFYMEGRFGRFIDFNPYTLVTGHHSYDGCKHNRLYCRTWWYCSFIIIIMRMTPLLNKHSDIHWEKVVAFILISVFIISVFGIQKSLRNPNFGFDFLATVRFGSGFKNPNRTEFRVTAHS